MKDLTPVPDAAVQIARARWNAKQGASVTAMDVRAVFRLLAELEAEVVALRAGADTVRQLHQPVTAPGIVYCETCPTEMGWPCPTVRALDALPPVDAPAPAPPPGEDVEVEWAVRNADGHLWPVDRDVPQSEREQVARAWTGAGDTTVSRAAGPWTPAGPQPAGGA